MDGHRYVDFKVAYAYKVVVLSNAFRVCYMPLSLNDYNCKCFRFQFIFRSWDTRQDGASKFKADVTYEGEEHHDNFLSTNWVWVRTESISILGNPVLPFTPAAPPFSNSDAILHLHLVLPLLKQVQPNIPTPNLLKFSPQPLTPPLFTRRMAYIHIYSGLPR
jgi:hypothetical protein